MTLRYPTSKPLNTELASNSVYMKGLDLQREMFKRAKILGNYDVMADVLENIKSEIKSKTIAKGRIEKIRAIEKILDWYRTKERNYIRMTPSGPQVKFPIDMPQRINHNLTHCYELIVDEVDKLNLL